MRSWSRQQRAICWWSKPNLEFYLGHRFERTQAWPWAYGFSLTIAKFSPHSAATWSHSPGYGHTRSQSAYVNAIFRKKVGIRNRSGIRQVTLGKTRNALNLRIEGVSYIGPFSNIFRCS